MARKISKTESKIRTVNKWISLSEIRNSLEKKGMNPDEVTNILKGNPLLEIRKIDGILMCTKESWLRFLDNKFRK